MFFLISCSSKLEKSDFYFNIGQEYFSEANFKKASKMFNLSIKKDPNNVKAVLQKANCMLYLGYPSKAKNLFEKAMIIDSLSPIVLNEIGVYFLQNDIEKAIKYLKQSIKIDSLYSPSYSSLGIAYSMKNELNSAMSNFNRAIELEPTKAYFYINRGEHYRINAEYDLALKDLNKAGDYSKSPLEISYASFSRGMFYRDIKEYNKSIDYFTNAINANPNNKMSFYYRGLSYSAIHKYKKALSDFRQSKTLGNKDVNKLISECEFMIKTGA